MLSRRVPGELWGAGRALSKFHQDVSREADGGEGRRASQRRYRLSGSLKDEEAGVGQMEAGVR